MFRDEPFVLALYPCMGAEAGVGSTLDTDELAGRGTSYTFCLDTLPLDGRPCPLPGGGGRCVGISIPIPLCGYAELLDI